MPEIFWAAFGGGLGGGLALILVERYRWFTNRPLLKCKASFGFTLNQNKVDRFMFLEAVNPHDKPVVVSSFGFYFKKKEWGTVLLNPEAWCSLPYEIGSQKSLVQKSKQEALFVALRKSGRSPKDLEGVYFYSLTGRRYRGKLHKNFRASLERDFYGSS